MKFYRLNDAQVGTAVSTTGTFETSETDAGVEYRFDEDDAVMLTINQMWFYKKDLDDLIDFLQFAKTQFKK